MSTLLAKIIADFTTSLATEIAIAGTSATLQSATDDDGVALPAGRYFFTIDGANSTKEHISADLSGTALTNIKTVSRQGVEAAGVLRKHRIGATVSITDFAHIFQINKLVSGATSFNASVPLGYDAVAALTPGSNQFCTVAYADALAIAGAPDASTTQKGIVEEATLAEVLARTTAGGTAARLFINPGVLPSTLMKDYAIDTGAADAYAMAPTPAITAYVTGQVFVFKATNANTTTSTLAVSGLAVKTIKNSQGNDLVANDILNGQVVVVVYDGTNMQMINDSGVGYVKLAGAQTIAGVKTFSSSPIAPTPSGATDVAIKSYVDGLVPVLGWKSGTTTKNIADASGVQNIAHGLGTTPRYIRIRAVRAQPGTGTYGGMQEANTVYNGTTQSSVSLFSEAGALEASTDFRLGYGGSSTYQTGVVTFDGTNIIITWTKQGSPTGTYTLLWEAF